jgi:hypothetical protein
MLTKISVKSISRILGKEEIAKNSDPQKGKPLREKVHSF